MRAWLAFTLVERVAVVYEPHEAISDRSQPIVDLAQERLDGGASIILDPSPHERVPKFDAPSAEMSGLDPHAIALARLTDVAPTLEEAAEPPDCPAATMHELADAVTAGSAVV